MYPILPALAVIGLALLGLGMLLYVLVKHAIVLLCEIFTEASDVPSYVKEREEKE